MTEDLVKPVDDKTQRCFICAEPILAGQLVLDDVSEGVGHRECFGNDRETFVKDLDTEEPLGPDDPLPTGYPYEPDGGGPYPSVVPEGRSKLAALIRERLLGVDPGDQDLELEDEDWQQIIDALNRPIAPPPSGRSYEDGVRDAARELITRRVLLNSQFEAVDILREDGIYAICIEAIEALTSSGAGK